MRRDTQVAHAEHTCAACRPGAIQAPQTGRAKSHHRPAPWSAGSPTSEVIDHLEYDFYTLAQRFREIAYLNKGLWICFRDERDFPPGLTRRSSNAPRHENRATRRTSTSRAAFSPTCASSTATGKCLQTLAVPPRPRGRRQRHGCNGRGGDPVQRRLPGLGLRLRQYDQHARGRLAPDRLPLGPDPRNQRLRSAQQATRREGSEHHWRGHPRRAYGGRLGQAERAAVRRSDQDEAWQPGDQGHRRVGHRRSTGRVSRWPAARGSADR